jgi:hypothetical protein
MFTALLALGTVLSAQASAVTGPDAALPLPLRRDIPSNFSTVICPDEAQARTFIETALVALPNGTDISTETFMRGLEATGCRQDGGPLQIEAVLVRKFAYPGPRGAYILYRAARPSGERVFGIVHEEGNNKVPRTPFEAWLELHTQDGVLTAGQNGRPTYLCPSPAAAQMVIRTLRTAKAKIRSQSRLQQALGRATAANNCRVTRDIFQVTKVHASAVLTPGTDPESLQDWTALSVTNAQGQTRGLVFDASLM